jgi:ClpP class serine protease
MSERRYSKFERSGLLAIDPRAMFEMFEEADARPNDPAAGDVEVVTIRGPLTRAASWWCDSYEAILARLGAACAGPAKSIVLRVDSPGGEASGLFEAVAQAQAMVAASGKRVIACVDGRACSAAYAWACVAPEVVVPPSGEAGSVGVISSRVDATEAARKNGYRVELTVSGKRKAYGHPQTKVTDEEREDERTKVQDLADQFFALVAESRGMSVDDVEALEAGTFLGQRAVDVKLADRVETFGNLMASLAATEGNNMSAQEKALAALQALVAAGGPKATQAKAALAALQAESAEDEEKDEESAEDEEKDEESAEDEEKDEESAEDEDEEDKAAATVSTKTAQALARKGQSLATRVARLEASRTNEKRAALLAARPDLTPELQAVLATKPVADVQAILAGIPQRKTRKPVPTEVGGPAARATGIAGLAGDAADTLALRMGLATVESRGVEKTEHLLVLGKPVIVKQSKGA